MQISQQNLLPYFQPIISADTNSIYGYEVLGRYIDDDGTVKSLGGFFTDTTKTNDEVLEVDRIIRKKALEAFSLYDENNYIFINMRLAWLCSFGSNPENMPTLVWAREYGIDYSRIVIEITEDEIDQNCDRYIAALSYYIEALDVR